MSLCIIAGAKTTMLALTTFTLSWTHSVEKVQWQEVWRVRAGMLEIIEARVRGSGAGMEPLEGAVLDGGWWRYRPEVAAVPELVLARSGTAGSWTISGAAIQPLALPESRGAVPLVLKACE